MAAAATADTVQLTFGLLATDKYPKTTLVKDVDALVRRIAEHGTYVGSTKVYDTYEKLRDIDILRAFLDFDIKRYKDGSAIPKYEGIVLREKVRDAFAAILPTLESKYGAVVLGDSSGMKTPVGEYAVSFRMWFPCVIGSRRAIQNFAEAIVAEHVLPEVQTCVGDAPVDWEKFFDTCVYKSITKLRLPGCTKQGEASRPLKIDLELSSKGVDYSDVLVTYQNPKYTVHALKEPDEVEVAAAGGAGARASQGAKEIEYTTVIPTPRKLADGQFTVLTALADFCSAAQWDDHTTRFHLIAALWNAETSERMHAFIHAQCAAKNSENEPASIEREISQALKYPLPPNTVRKYAWDVRSDDVAKLHAEHIYACDSLFRSQEEDLAIREILRTDQIDPKVWVQVTYSERFVQPYPIKEYDTLVVHSHMGTGKTAQLTGTASHKITSLVKDYARILVLSARRTYAAFVFAEFQREGHTDFQNYLDVKGRLSGHARLVLQMESLHRLAEDYTPYNLVIMDESESLLAQMHSVGTHGLHHRDNYEILQRVVHEADKVIALDAFLTNRTLDFLEILRAGRPAILIKNQYQPYDRHATECVTLSGANIMPNVRKMHSQILEHARGGRRIVYICSSKEKGYTMLEELEKAGISVIFHCGDDTREKKDLLLDVRAAWREYQVVIYTSTITVGVSYSDIPEEVEFDELYLYASAGCALPRDIAQALLRVRKIKTNHLWFCVERRCVMPRVYGLKKVTDAVRSRKENPALKDLHWAETPDWAVRLIAQNENEIAVSRRYYSSVLRQYLRLSGYTLTDPILDKTVTEKTVRAAQKPAFAEIELLDEDAAVAVEAAIVAETATLEDRLRLMKYRFVGLFETGVDMGFMEDVWNTFMCGAKKTYEAQFWNIVNERKRNLRRAWAAETAHRYAEQARSTLLQQTAVTRLCEALGLDHTCQEKLWTHAEFLTIVPAVLALEAEVRDALGMRASERMDKESEFNRAADFIKSALGAWSGSKVEKVNGKQKRGKGERVREYDVAISPLMKGLWTCLKEEK